MSHKKPGRNNEWIITLVRKDDEEDKSLVGNGLYWVQADHGGGWTRLLTKCQANQIRMDGSRCPKKNDAIHDILKDYQTTFSQKGFTVELPTSPIPYTKLIKELTKIGELPDSTNAAAPQAMASSVVTVGHGVAPQPEAASTQQKPDNIQIIVDDFTSSVLATPAQVSLDSTPVTTMASTPGIQSLSDAFNAEVQENMEQIGVGTETIEAVPTIPPVHANDADVDLLTSRIDILEAKISSLETENRSLRENNLQCEENAAKFQVDNTERLSNVIRGSLDAGLSKFASANEFRIQREVEHMSKFVRDEVSKTVVSSLSTSLVTTVNKAVSDAVHTAVVPVLSKLSDQLTTVNSSVISSSEEMAEVVKKSELLDRNQATLYGRMGQLGTNVAETLQVAKAIHTLNNSSQPSLVTPPARPNPALPQNAKCTYCNGSGHTYLTCTAKPPGYTCVRCRSPRHHEDNCPSLAIPCQDCHDVGHHAVIHGTVNPVERQRILTVVGFKNFTAFLTAPPAAKRLKMDN